MPDNALTMIVLLTDGRSVLASDLSNGTSVEEIISRKIRQLNKGAKIPIYKVNRFPFQFQMYSPNILKGKEQQFWDVNGNGDYLVQGRICRQIDEEITTSIVSSDSIWSSSIASATTTSTSQSERSLPCTESESIFVGTGVSKLLKNVPGLEEGDVIRTAVSVPLSKNK